MTEEVDAKAKELAEALALPSLTSQQDRNWSNRSVWVVAPYSGTTTCSLPPCLSSSTSIGNLVRDKVNRRNKSRTADTLCDRANKHRGYVPSTRRSGELECTVHMCLGRREAVDPEYTVDLCLHGDGNGGIIRYEAPNSFNHCQAVRLRESELPISTRWRASNSSYLLPSVGNRLLQSPPW